MAKSNEEKVEELKCQACGCFMQRGTRTDCEYCGTVYPPSATDPLEDFRKDQMSVNGGTSCLWL